MVIYVGNKIVVQDPTAETMGWCRRELVLANPDYYKKKSMGKWTGNTPEHIFLYEKVADRLYLPFGCLAEVYAKYRASVPFKRLIAPLRRINYQSGISLYPYQESAVKAALRARNGIVVMPCGAGKTQTALELIARIGGRALWLTHTQDLLNQSLNRAKATLGIDTATYGTITAGKVNVGYGITFATVQTMCKIDLTQYRDAWDIIVVDECHKAIGSPTKVMQFYKVLSALSCRHKYGFTATPKRADGLEKSMFALLGGIVCEVPRAAVASTTCPVEVVSIETGYTPDVNAVTLGDGTLNYSALVDDLTGNQERFALVAGKCSECARAGATLVLANRVKYVQKLSDAFSGRSICLSTLGNSKAGKAARKDALRRLNDGELDAVFATYQLAAEGLDCPNLRYVVFATPEKDERIVEQASGRVARKSEGKGCGTIIDFIDNFGMYKGWTKRRESIYKKLGYAII